MLAEARAALPRNTPTVVLSVGLVVALGAVVAGYAGLALLVALVGPLALAMYHRPQFGILAVVALAPFDGVLDILGVPQIALAWKEVLIGLTFALTFVCPSDARAPRGRRLPGWFPAVAGFVLVGLVSALAHHDVQSIAGLKITYFYLLVPFVLWRCPFSAGERDRLVTVLMATGFLCAVIGLLQQLVGAAALNALGYPYNETIRFAGGFLRSFSTFDQPFPFALFEMVVLLVGIPTALSQPGRLRSRLFLFALPIYTVGMLSAFVRSAVLGLGIGLVYLGFRRHRVLLLGLPLTIVAAVILGVLGGSLTQTFGSGSSLGQRRSGWQENTAQVVAHPLGAGIGSTGAAALKAQEFAKAGEVYEPDNYYFKTVYELGVIGLWLFVLILLSGFRCTAAAAQRLAGANRALVDGIAAQILGAAVASAVANYFEIFPVDLLFWMLLGVAATTARMVEPMTELETGPDTDTIREEIRWMA